jgi:CBS domain-containing protein
MISPAITTVSNSETRSERLPVVDNPTLRRLIGSISKTDIILYLAG